MGHGVHSGKFGGVECHWLVVQLSGARDKLKTGGRIWFEYGDKDGGFEMLSFLNPVGEYDNANDALTSDVFSLIFLSIILKPREAF